MKLLRVSLSLTEKGFRLKQTEWDATEKNSIYSIKPDTFNNLEKMEGWPEKEKRIKKEKLMTPENVTNDTHKMVGYSVWCLPEQENEAKDKLNKLVRTIVTYIKEEADKLYAHL